MNLILLLTSKMFGRTFYKRKFLRSNYREFYKTLNMYQLIKIVINEQLPETTVRILQTIEATN